MNDFNYEVQKVLNKIRKWALISIVVNTLILVIVIYMKINE